MARKRMEPTIVWENKPDASALWRVLCDALNRQDAIFEYVPASRERTRCGKTAEVAECLREEKR